MSSASATSLSPTWVAYPLHLSNRPSNGHLNTSGTLHSDPTSLCPHASFPPQGQTLSIFMTSATTPASPINSSKPDSEAIHLRFCSLQSGHSLCYLCPRHCGHLFAGSQVLFLLPGAHCLWGSQKDLPKLQIRSFLFLLRISQWLFITFRMKLKLLTRA